MEMIRRPNEPNFQNSILKCKHNLSQILAKFFRYPFIIIYYCECWLKSNSFYPVFMTMHILYYQGWQSCSTRIIVGYVYNSPLKSLCFGGLELKTCKFILRRRLLAEFVLKSSCKRERQDITKDFNCYDGSCGL